MQSRQPRRLGGTVTLLAALGLGLGAHWASGSGSAFAGLGAAGAASARRWSTLKALGGESSASPYPKPREGVAWKDLGFGLTTTDTSVAVATCPRGGEWSGCTVKPYGPLALDPAATILNYGQGVFEGMKAFRTTKGRIVLFRPEMNAERMASGAERFLMPPVPTSLFLDTVAATVRANANWVPPVSEGELYLRPLLFGSGGSLGVGPSPEFTFLIYGAPVGKYFKGQGARLLVEEQHQRAAPQGSGDVKCMGNYAPCFKAQAEARGEGYSDILYLDVSGVHIEEAAASNFFIVDAEGVLRTPKLQGTILPGVTRDSVLQLAELFVQRGGTELTGVEVGDVSLEQVFNAREAFVTGTGAGVTPVAHVARSSGTAVDFATPGPATSKLQKAIQDVKLESVEDELGWLWDPFVGA